MARCDFSRDLLDDAWLESYDQGIDLLSEQILKLNMCIYALKKITIFPFELFDPFVEHHFWKLVIDSLFETCVMTFWRIAVDENKEGLTLNQFKNQIRSHFTDHAYSKSLNELVKKRHFDDGIKRIKIVRHNFIAHMNREQHINPNGTALIQGPLELSELEQYQKTVNEYFDLLNFEKSFATLPGNMSVKHKKL